MKIYRFILQQLIVYTEMNMKYLYRIWIYTQCYDMTVHNIHYSLRYWQFIICDVSYPVNKLVDFSIDPRNVRHSAAETPWSDTCYSPGVCPNYFLTQ